MKVHHLNCGSMCPGCLPWLRADGRFWGRASFVCHCLLVETRAGLVLVDTGFGRADVQAPQRLGRLFTTLLRPNLSLQGTAAAQVQALGFELSAVRHVITTHLDVDHGGGIADFPDAQVHVHELEWQAANHPGLLDGLRYHPQAWSSHAHITCHGVGGERWFGFEGVRCIPELGDDILMIPLRGHTLGHCGVAVRQGDGWLLHCGDAYYSQLDMQPGHEAPLGMRLFANLLQKDRGARLRNLDRLRQLAQSPSQNVTLICGHDPMDFHQAVDVGQPAPV